MIIVMSHKNCVLLVTHKQDKEIRCYIEHIEKVANGLMDFHVLYDCANSNPSPNLSNNLYVFNSELLKGFFYGKKTLIPNPLLVLLNFAKEKHYEHYLVMEFDIVLDGSLREFIYKVNSIKDIDYIHIGYDEDGDPQKHWPIKYIEGNQFKKLYFAWCHIFYVSHEFLMDVGQFMEKTTLSIMNSCCLQWPITGIIWLNNLKI